VPLQLPIPNEIPQGCAADADQSRGWSSFQLLHKNPSADQKIDGDVGK
jgi:hypothetical protein